MNYSEKHWWESKTHWYNIFTFIRDSGLLTIAVASPWELWLTPAEAAGVVMLMRILDGMVVAAIRNTTNTAIR